MPVMGKDAHAWYLKELMRLMPTAYREGKELFALEREQRSLGLTEKAEQFRDVKMAIYDFTAGCRQRNGRLIESAALNRKEWRFLRMRFIRGYTWEQLFNTQGYSSDHCKRIHRDAIAKIARANRHTDFQPLYEQEQARLDALLRQVGEKE